MQPISFRFFTFVSFPSSMSRVRSPSPAFARYRELRLASQPSLLPANYLEHLIPPPFHQLRRGRLEIQAEQRLGIRRAHVKVPVVVVHRDAVEVGELRIRVTR